jgi:hypothetical protein
MPPFPQSPGPVVLFNAEDDLADTIEFRLDMAEANDINIIGVEGVSMHGQRRLFSLKADLPRLEEVLFKSPGTRLVVTAPSLSAVA